MNRRHFLATPFAVALAPTTPVRVPGRFAMVFKSRAVGPSFAGMLEAAELYRLDLERLSWITRSLRASGLNLRKGAP